MAVVGIYPVVGHFPALHMVILSPISRDVKQLLQQSNNLLINCPGFNFWGHWALSDYNICSFFEVTGFASRRWAASSYQAVFMGRRPMPRQRGLFVKSPLWNPEKQRLTFIVWFFIVYSQGIKRPAYMPTTRLRRRNALVQRDASLTRKIAIGDSLHACSA